jgi:hypothetical protein
MTKKAQGNPASNSSPRRKSLGKTARFEVFKRDHFTCQYCGAQPPSVVLIVDHILPVSKGGGNEDTNLTTACEPCNQGKKARILADVPIRPDADLLYMANQQEVAELKRLEKSKRAVHKHRMNFCEAVLAEWDDVSGEEWQPAPSVILSMLSKGQPESAHAAIMATARKVFDGSVKKSGWYPYAWGCFWKIEKEDNNG